VQENPPVQNMLREIGDGSVAKALKQSDYPNVLRLFEKLEADPAVAFAHAIEEERPAKSAHGFRGHVTLVDFRNLLRA
jgi:hypothetical protein